MAALPKYPSVELNGWVPHDFDYDPTPDKKKLVTPPSPASDPVPAPQEASTPKEPKKWFEVEKNPEFQALSAEDKYAAREDYFNKVIAPNVPEDQRASVKDDFYSKTHGRLFNTGDEIGLAVNDTGRGAADVLSFGLADKAVAAGRAAFSSDLDYDRALAEERERTRSAKDRLGWAGTTLDLGFGVAGGAALAKKGLTLVGREGVLNSGMLTKLAAGALEGAGYGGLDALGHDTDIQQGASLGAGIGGAAGALAPLVGGIARRLPGTAGRSAQLADGTNASLRDQVLLNRELGGGVGQTSLQKGADMGADTLALNVNDFLHSEARAARNFGGEAGATVSDALNDQFGRRSDRILAGVDDALGKTSVPYEERVAELAAREKNLSSQYTGVLENADVNDVHRAAIRTQAEKSASDFAPESSEAKILRQLGKVEGLTATQIKNNNNTLDQAAKAYPHARQQIFDLKRANNSVLNDATNGRYGDLQSQVSAIRAEKEALDRAYGFVSGRITKKGNIKPVTPDMIQRDKSAFPNATLDAARSRVVANVRSGSNDMTALRQSIGRDQNTIARDNAKVMFGEPAVEKIAQTLDNEAAKSTDYASIMRNSTTARNLSAMAKSDAGSILEYIPHSLNPISLVSQFRGLALRKFNEFAGTRDTAARRALLAKVSTMQMAELKNLIGALDKANRARKGSDASLAHKALISGIMGRNNNER